MRGKDKIGEPHQIGNIVRRIVAPNGCVDLICDDYCRDKTPEDREAAFRRMDRIIYNAWLTKGVAPGYEDKVIFVDANK